MRLLMALVLILPNYGRAQDLCDFPVPNYTIEVNEAESFGMNKVTFMALMNYIEKVYSPVFAGLGCPLDLQKDWNNGTINAQAWQSGGFCHVQMFGGFARLAAMDRETMAAVACHEIGHHLGGWPFWAGTNLSAEGQADHYATLVCMKKLGIPSMRASLALAKVLGRLNGEAAVPSRNTRAQERVRVTLQSHPRAQCRLDQMDSGRVGGPRLPCWFAGRGIVAEDAGQEFWSNANFGTPEPDFGLKLIEAEEDLALRLN